MNKGGPAAVLCVHLAWLVQESATTENMQLAQAQIVTEPKFLNAYWLQGRHARRAAISCSQQLLLRQMCTETCSSCTSGTLPALQLLHKQFETRLDHIIIKQDSKEVIHTQLFAALPAVDSS